MEIKKHLGKSMKSITAGFFSVLMVAMFVLPSGVVKADSIVADLTDMPGSAGYGISSGTGFISFTPESYSWSPSTQRFSYYAHAQALGVNQEYSRITGSVHGVGYYTFNITTPGTHNITVNYHVDVNNMVYYSGSGNPSAVFQDVYLQLKNNTGAVVISDLDRIISTGISSRNAQHYVISPIQQISIDLPVGTYTVYVGTYTTLSCIAWGTGGYSYAWSSGYCDVEGLSITT